MVEMGPDPSRSRSAKLILIRPDLNPQKLIKNLLFYNAKGTVPIRFKTTAALHVRRHIRNVLIYIER